MKKNYGVWGLGVVGKSVLAFLHAHKQKFEIRELSVMDKRLPTADEEDFLKSHAISFIHQNQQEQFFELNDYIVPSPGIDTQKASSYHHKMIEEIDLFFDEWKRPLIAVTGTVGKTSIVHLLSKILETNGVKLATGGNIGTGMLDLIDQEADHALLELSSFQLERAQRFAPDLAIITNLYPNHLDRHGDMQRYFQAKYRVSMHQSADQKALIPFSLLQEFRRQTAKPLNFFTTEHLERSMLTKLGPNDSIYILRDSQIRRLTHASEKLIFDLRGSQDLSYKENWLIIIAACDLLGLMHESLLLPHLDLPHHRLEKVRVVNGITFYNDSKSTIPESTHAALKHLSHGTKKVHLFLGGLSKGVDRSVSIAQMKEKVASVTCFGAEADQLFEACKKASIPVSKAADLEEAFKICLEQAQANDIVLFSPAGSSYDLFKDYKERGTAFVKLVKHLQET